MTDLVEVRVSNLAGSALDWAVAKAVGENSPQLGIGGVCVVAHGHTLHRFCPSTEWSHGGPLIDKYRGSVRHDKHLNDGPCRYTGGTGMDSPWSYGPTPLNAFCRSLVLAKLGDTVQVPKELCQ